VITTTKININFMNKNDLISAIAEETGFTKTNSKTILESITGTITKSLSNGDKVQLAGFGTWEAKTRAARKGRNPKTGETIDIAEKTVAKFKPSAKLNEAVNK